MWAHGPPREMLPSRGRRARAAAVCRTTGPGSGLGWLKGFRVSGSRCRVEGLGFRV